MAYTPYYNNGWVNSESGGTPITAEALNHMEDGIAANSTAVEKLVPGELYNLSGVTSSYESAHILTYDGRMLGPNNTPNTAFLVALQTRATVGRAALYSVTISDSECVVVPIGSDTTNLRILTTTYGNPYVISSSASEAGWNVGVTIIKTR